MTTRTVFDTHAREYDDWFDEHHDLYQAEVHALRSLVPRSGRGIEIGAGSGRFTAALGINFGVEPSLAMAALAHRRGVSVCQARGEALPFADAQFAFALLVTVICFVDDVTTLLREVGRVLVADGEIIIGFIDRNSPLGRQYEAMKNDNPFYREARFYSVVDVARFTRAAGFVRLRYRQTILSPLDGIGTGLDVRDGHGQGAFVVLHARKRSA